MFIAGLLASAYHRHRPPTPQFMKQNRHWDLGTKLMLVGVPFLLLVLLATAATLWVSWQLDGGAAAVIATEQGLV